MKNFFESHIEEAALDWRRCSEMFGGRSAHLTVLSEVESDTNRAKMARETLKYQGKFRIAQRIAQLLRDNSPKDTAFLASRHFSRQSVAIGVLRYGGGLAECWQ